MRSPISGRDAVYRQVIDVLEAQVKRIWRFNPFAITARRICTAACVSSGTFDRFVSPHGVYDSRRRTAIDGAGVITSGSRKDVLIVGGGFARLACARRLNDGQSQPCRRYVIELVR